MNLWLRLLCVIAAVFLRPRPVDPLGVGRLRFTVMPHDLDTSLHMNNGRYLTLMDLGRTDLILRTGLWRAVMRRRWTPVVTGAQVRFRRELRLFRRFTLETQVLGWSDTRMVMEHRMLSKDGAVAAIALVQAGFYDRAARAFVPASDLLAAAGGERESPPLRPDVAAFLASDDALKAATAGPVRAA